MERNHYELTAILRPEGGPDAIKQFAERVDAIVNDFGGKVITLHSWGERKLAYEIKKNLKGHYLLFDIVGNGKMVEEVERNFNIWEVVLKFMSIKVDKVENLDEMVESAKGIASLFEKQEKKPASDRPYDEPRNEFDDVRKYNEELQKSLGGAGEEEEEVTL